MLAEDFGSLPGAQDSGMVDRYRPRLLFCGLPRDPRSLITPCAAERPLAIDQLGNGIAMSD